MGAIAATAPTATAAATVQRRTRGPRGEALPAATVGPSRRRLGRSHDREAQRHSGQQGSAERHAASPRDGDEEDQRDQNGIAHTTSGVRSAE
jgi:hypothetical protein